jgi:hypothetical protein
MSTVYILGAGASKAVNPETPLSADLLPQALNLSVSDNEGKYVKNIRDFIRDFYFYGSDRLNETEMLPNLEDVLSQLDYAIAENRPIGGEYPVSKLIEIYQSFVYAICEVLRQSLNTTSGVLEEFLKGIEADDTVISLNYELLLDNAIVRTLKQPINYGVETRTQQRNSRMNAPETRPHSIALYKLHGSLNWLYCSSCQEIVVTQSDKGVQYIFSLSQQRSKGVCDQCGSRYEPLIITPSLTKSYANLLLNEIWRQAEDRIARADQLVFVGYSMPDADAYVKAMFKRAIYINIKGYKRDGARQDTRFISVIDYDPDYDPEQRNEIQNRYVRLFGSVEYYPQGFRSFINHKAGTTASSR